MSATVAAVAAACAAVPPAVAFGAASGVLVSTWSQRVRARSSEQLSSPAEAGELTEEDRDTVEAEFGVYASAAARQVSDYADALAYGDPALRARLQRLERRLGRRH